MVHFSMYSCVAGLPRYIRQKEAISYLDLQQVNLMYSCPGSESNTDNG